MHLLERVSLTVAVIVAKVLNEDGKRIGRINAPEFERMLLILTVKQNCRRDHPRLATRELAKYRVVVLWQSRIDEGKSDFSRLDRLHELHSAPLLRKPAAIGAVRVDEGDDPGVRIIFNEDLFKVAMVKELSLIPMNAIKSCQIFTRLPDSSGLL